MITKTQISDEPIYSWQLSKWREARKIWLSQHGNTYDFETQNPKPSEMRDVNIKDVCVGCDQPIYNSLDYFKSHGNYCQGCSVRANQIGSTKSALDFSERRLLVLIHMSDTEYENDLKKKVAEALLKPKGKRTNVRKSYKTRSEEINWHQATIKTSKKELNELVKSCKHYYDGVLFN